MKSDFIERVEKAQKDFYETILNHLENQLKKDENLKVLVFPYKDTLLAYQYRSPKFN